MLCWQGKEKTLLFIVEELIWMINCSRQVWKVDVLRKWNNANGSKSGVHQTDEGLTTCTPRHLLTHAKRYFHPSTYTKNKIDKQFCTNKLKTKIKMKISNCNLWFVLTLAPFFYNCCSKWGFFWRLYLAQWKVW